MKRKAAKIAINLAIMLATVGAVVIFSNHTDANPKEDLATQLKKGTAHLNDDTPMFDHMKPATVNKIKASWDRAEDKLRKQQTSLLSANDEWRRINYADIDIEFTNQLTQKEAFSFNGAITSDVKQKALQLGDYFPAVLINKKQDSAILFWERKNGNAVVINIKSKPASDGTREWYVDGPAEEIVS